MGKGFAVVADEIRKLATESGETVTTIQEVTDSVVKAVNQLTKDSKRLLDFVETDVKSSCDSFESLRMPTTRIPSLWTVSIGFQCDIRGTPSFHGWHDERDRGRCKCGKRGRKRNTDMADRIQNITLHCSEVAETTDKAGAAAQKLKADTEIFRV